MMQIMPIDKFFTMCKYSFSLYIIQHTAKLESGFSTISKICIKFNCHKIFFQPQARILQIRFDTCVVSLTYNTSCHQYTKGFYENI